MRSTIKEIKPPYKPADKYGKVSSIVTFADGVDGFFNYKPPITFVVGEEVDYTAEAHQKKDDPSKSYNVLTISKIGTTSVPPTPPQSFKANNPDVKVPMADSEIKNQKVLACFKAIECCSDNLNAETLKPEGLADRYRIYVDLLHSEIDSVYQKA